MSGNLFEIRMDWPVPPSINTSSNITIKPYPATIKMEPQDPNQLKPSSTVRKLERCRWGPNCPICKNAQVDWDGEHQKQLQQSDVQQKYPPQGQDTKQVQDPQSNKNYQLPQSLHPQISFNVPD